VTADHADYTDQDLWRRLASAAAANPVRAGVHVSWVRCESGWTWQHRLPDFDLWAVTDGAGTATMAGETVRLSAGTVLMQSVSAAGSLW
jgi:hypothetical protein